MKADRVVYYVTRQTYRGREGWHVGSRGLGWNISIFVDTREQAVEIRDGYRAGKGEEACNRVFDSMTRPSLTG